MAPLHYLLPDGWEDSLPNPGTVDYRTWLPDWMELCSKGPQVAKVPPWLTLWITQHGVTSYMDKPIEIWFTSSWKESLKAFTLDSTIKPAQFSQQLGTFSVPMTIHS